MPQAAADTVLQGWVETAKAQTGNSSKTILSLFDRTGVWSQPYVDAGYNVVRVDLADGLDVNDFSVEYLIDTLELDEVVGVLAACPCTDFSASGARWWNEKDADGRTAASIELVKQTLRTIEYFNPTFWAIENPVGRIQRVAGLPEPRLIFQPHHYGDPYTKKTMLYGQFNADLPQANVEPTEGSRVHKLRGNVPEEKEARSTTPEGFAYAFFMANAKITDRAVEPAVVAQNSQQPALELVGQTPEEAKAEADAIAASAKAEKDAADKIEADAKKKRIADEVASRQEESAKNFVLGQSAEDALAGQGDIFSAPPSPPAKPKAQPAPVGITADDIPPMILQQIAVTMPVINTRTNMYQQREVSATEAISTTDADIKQMQALLDCLKA